MPCGARVITIYRFTDTTFPGSLKPRVYISLALLNEEQTAIHYRYLPAQPGSGAVVVAPSIDSPITISVIVPVLNEADQIELCLAPLAGPGVEIIIADGGNADATFEHWPARVTRVVRSKRGRAWQMNAGAAVAQGKLLVFLHADTRLSSNAWQRLQSLAHLDDPLWGFFKVRLSGSGWIYQLIAAMMNLRSRFTHICTGDQVMFVSADLFKSCGGFPEIALMEDIAVSSLLAHFQAPRYCLENVTTSSRRWRRDGIFKTIVLMWRLRLAYFLGVDPQRLADIYYQEHNI